MAIQLKPFQWSRPAARAVELLALEAATAIAAAARRRHSDGRYRSEQDILFHVGFLVGSLETGEVAYFTNYVRWLTNVLQSRDVPVALIEESLSSLLGFYKNRLETAAFNEVSRVLKGGLSVLAAASRPEEAGQAVRSTDRSDELARCLIDGRTDAARTIALEATRRHPSYVYVATRLFQPALYRIGAMWERNQISVAQEHLATSIASTLLMQLYNLVGKAGAANGRRALFAAVEKDQHVIGLRMVSEAFQLAGWSVQYLGADTPTLSLLDQVDRFKPDLIGLSVSLVQQLPATRYAVDALHTEFASARPVVAVGGLPTNQIEGIWRWIGADAWSTDARGAVRRLG